MSISIVSMVNQSSININTNHSDSDVCPILTPTTNSSIPDVSKGFDFIWNSLI